MAGKILHEKVTSGNNCPNLIQTSAAQRFKRCSHVCPEQKTTPAKAEKRGFDMTIIKIKY